MSGERENVELAIARLLDPRVSVAVEASANGPGMRALEFAAGRACARRALARLGRDCDIGANPDGAPAWPEGFVGSITHSGGLAAAIVVATDVHRGVGLDLLRARSLPLDRAELFCLPSELEQLARAPRRERAELLLRTFCAKESAQKCLRPLLQRLPRPEEVEISWIDRDRFSARVHDETLTILGRCARYGSFRFAASFTPSRAPVRR